MICGVFAANVEHKLAWKVSSDWATDLAKVKFEILTSDYGILPMDWVTIPAASPYSALTISNKNQSDNDIFNAMLWLYACGDKSLENKEGYIETTDGVRLVNRTTFPNRMITLMFVYEKMGCQALIGGNVLSYARHATRLNLGFNSVAQTAAILKGSLPNQLFVSDKAFLVIDLSSGSDAAHFPISYLNSEQMPQWDDAFKTEKIILRLVGPGTYLMGGRKRVTLTHPFYMGVYPITQRQYELIMGENPTPVAHRAPKRPAEVSWNSIRGDSSVCDWPMRTIVDENSFIGILRAKTGLAFDLPTEGQWEYACRAGTESNYHNGGNAVADRELVASEGSETVDVGLFAPNNLGLYDMLGNAGHWCLDKYEDLNDDPVTDPLGDTNGTRRVVRGCNYSRSNINATSSFRRGEKPERHYSSDNGFTYETSGICAPLGFRLCLTLSE